MIAIKNNKVSIPDSIHGFLTAINLTGEPSIGLLVYRSATTNRRVWGGQNHWDLFGFVMQDGYRAIQSEDGIVLGRYNGANICVKFQRQIAPELPLPNGFDLPAEWEDVAVYFSPSCPNNQSYAEGLWQYVQFNSGGGPDSTPDVCPDDLYKKELVSYFALTNPAIYRPLHGKFLDEIISASDLIGSVNHEME